LPNIEYRLDFPGANPVEFVITEFLIGICNRKVNDEFFPILIVTRISNIIRKAAEYSAFEKWKSGCLNQFSNIEYRIVISEFPFGIRQNRIECIQRRITNELSTIQQQTHITNTKTFKTPLHNKPLFTNINLILILTSQMKECSFPLT